MANVQVVHMSDPAAMAQFGPMIEMAEQMTGRDLNGDGVIGPAHGGTRPPGGMPSGTPGMPYGTPSGMPSGGPQYPPAGDAISQLERLAALHTAGQLTDDEFDEAKRRIIGR
jgi:hypothetical protein